MVTFQFVPYQEIQNLSSNRRLTKLLNVVKENKIVVMEGRLRKEEEADLIKMTMEEITPGFKGVELSIIYPDLNQQHLMQKLRSTFASLLLGDRQGLTIIGPASVVRKIEQDLHKVELFTNEARRMGLRRRKKFRRDKVELV